MSDEKKEDKGGGEQAGESPPKEEPQPPPPPSQPAVVLNKDVAGGLQHHVVPTERCGALNAYVDGDLTAAYKEKDSKCVFLCVHDVGCNHRSIKKFISHDAFEEIKKRVVVVYVDLPGHETGASEIKDGKFPTMQQVGEDLVTVLDQLRIKHVIGLGDGAGANILARFAMMHVTRCMGVILLHPTSNKAAMTKNFARQFSKVAPSGENMALFRRFGHKIDANLKDDEALKALEQYKSTFGADINKKNIKMYVEAYSNRQDISALLINMKCDALLVVGSKTSHIAAAEHMHTCMDKTRSSILKIDGVGNVLDEAPIKLANCVLLFCKGLGWLTSVNLPGIETRRQSQDGQRARAPSFGVSGLAI